MTVSPQEVGNKPLDKDAPVRWYRVWLFEFKQTSKMEYFKHCSEVNSRSGVHKTFTLL